MPLNLTEVLHWCSFRVVTFQHVRFDSDPELWQAVEEEASDEVDYGLYQYEDKEFDPPESKHFLRKLVFSNLKKLNRKL